MKETKLFRVLIQHKKMTICYCVHCGLRLRCSQF